MEKIDILERLRQDHPDEPETWYLIGLARQKDGDWAEALQAYAQALENCEGALREKVLSAMETLPDLRETDAPGDTLEEATDAGPADVLQPFRLVEGGHGDAGPSPVRFEDVGGLEEIKNAIRMRIIKPFADPGLFARFGQRAGGGVLLYGPPGCGKTFLARATAGECNARFIHVSITDILSPYYGVSPQLLHEAFEAARASRPCVIFIDEADTLGYSRNKSGSELVRALVDQFLSELDGAANDNKELLVLGATNMPWDMDPALKRPGRFDRMFFVPPPDLPAREAIFSRKLQDLPVGPVDLKALAAATELFSGADIEHVVSMAGETVLEEILLTGVDRPIGQADLLAAVNGHVPSTLEWLLTIKNYVRYANQSGLYEEVAAYLKKQKRLL